MQLPNLYLNYGMDEKRETLADIIFAFFAFLALFILLVRAWQILFSGKSGRWIFILLMILLLGLGLDSIFHTGLFIKND